MYAPERVRFHFALGALALSLEQHLWSARLLKKCVFHAESPAQSAVPPRGPEYGEFPNTWPGFAFAKIAMFPGKTALVDRKPNSCEIFWTAVAAPI
jgi:hypothetical protein